MTVISTSSITSQVTNAIRQSIVTGEYEPGKKLSEAALSEHFGVSRTPVREALKQLEREGLVEIIPRVGTCVFKPTDKELKELFTVKEVMEGLAAGLLAERGSFKEILDMEQAVAKMEQAVKVSDNSLFVEANSEFHKAILEGSDNSKLSYLFNILLNQIPYNRYVYLSIEVPNRLEQSLLEHKEVLDLVKKGDSKGAEEAMRNHVKASALHLQTGIMTKLYK
ncbi:GntR family transcriptional regulator [Alkalihalobacillus deserti]|uniref:GntR family transcriptional regulator n=1 Tax=Alkalihalobacillus deserti TaxID=2879466 RepID=UPI001D13A584|nr:GntR family transcriptional regulator [Alkalihalobacillus deserti]